MVRGEDLVEPGGGRGEAFASEVARLGTHALAHLADDAAPAAKEEAMLSAMLAEKVRQQAGEIQALLDKVGRLEEEAEKAARPACTSLDKKPVPGVVGSDTLLFRDGLPSFKEHNEVVKQLAQLSKEYRQVCTPCTPARRSAAFPSRSQCACSTYAHKVKRSAERPRVRAA